MSAYSNSSNVWQYVNVAAAHSSKAECVFLVKIHTIFNYLDLQLHPLKIVTLPNLYKSSADFTGAKKKKNFGTEAHKIQQSQIKLQKWFVLIYSL
ncbi:hypothetical protein PR048_015987 [Dryococelus australis]|uniref:Uncharacterized protein n=1 Tax=Dryococelus australis TaxID=614101 RepID=A0ABQ9HIG7_9NEOP|nr:hypothetical protein PR048_015987 [Dryococelus australis]